MKRTINLTAEDIDDLIAVLEIVLQLLKSAADTNTTDKIMKRIAVSRVQRLLSLYCSQ